MTDSAGCSALSGVFFEGVTCATDTCLGASGACCTADKDCVEMNLSACIAAGGSFQGSGTTCDLNCSSHLGTGFTFQGQLKEGGAPLTANVDLKFSLWTAREEGTPIGTAQTFSDTEVVNGLFTVVIDQSLPNVLGTGWNCDCMHNVVQSQKVQACVLCARVR